MKKKKPSLVIRVGISEENKNRLAQEAVKTGRTIREIAEVLMDEICSGRIVMAMKKKINAMRCCGNCKYDCKHEEGLSSPDCGEELKLWEFNENLLKRNKKLG